MPVALVKCGARVSSRPVLSVLVVVAIMRTLSAEMTGGTVTTIPIRHTNIINRRFRIIGLPRYLI
jgi:hypothetical protein